MNTGEHILIETRDCNPFCLSSTDEDVIVHFAKSVSKCNVFNFSTNERDDDDLSLAQLDYSTGQWWAGRMVGEANFIFKEKKYRIIIKPRFGELFLFKMLEEIFNVKLAPSNSVLNQSKEFQFLIKKLICFLWLNMLAKANKHGLPKSTVSKIHQGKTVRGRIKVVKSVRPYYEKGEIVSKYYEKEYDNTIAKILLQAYYILQKDYGLKEGILNFPNNAMDAIIQLEGCNLESKHISPAEYNNIKYKDIYKSFKPVVDFSWELILRKRVHNKLQDNLSTENFSFFIDMAEVWELYLKSILKKHFAPYGWVVRNDKLLTYEGNLFQRHLIPDIVLQKDKEVMVWDAKYKRMFFRNQDVDRNDFFQIHTYIQYYQQNNNVISGGLLYPLSSPVNKHTLDKMSSRTLYGKDVINTKFLVDGIDLSFLNKENEGQDLIIQQINEKKIDFTKRIENAVNCDDRYSA